MNSLMSRLLISVGFILAFIGSGGVLNAQNLNLFPNDTIERTGFMEDLETLTISFKNLNSSPLVLKWKKVSAVVPADWEAAVCDNKICYTGLEDSGTMNPVDSLESAFLLLHITSKINYGTATVRYVVWDAGDPQINDTLTYILRVEAPSRIGNMKQDTSISIYPNPANGLLHIQTMRQAGFHYMIKDISGKRVCDGFSESSEMTLSTESIKTGLYYLSIPDENGQLRTLKFIISH